MSFLNPFSCRYQLKVGQWVEFYSEDTNDPLHESLKGPFYVASIDTRFSDFRADILNTKADMLDYNPRMRSASGVELPWKYLVRTLNATQVESTLVDGEKMESVIKRITAKFHEVQQLRVAGKQKDEVAAKKFQDGKKDTK